MTYPPDERVPAALVRPWFFPPPPRHLLRVAVAAHEQGDWELRIRADGEVIHRQVVSHGGDRWKQVRVDLSAYAGAASSSDSKMRSGTIPAFGYWLTLPSKGPSSAVRP